MTYERELTLRKMAASGGLHGVMVSEVRQLEQKYGIRCSSTACGSCVMTFLNSINRIKPIADFIRENEDGEEQTEQ